MTNCTLNSQLQNMYMYSFPGDVLSPSPLTPPPAAPAGDAAAASAPSPELQEEARRRRGAAAHTLQIMTNDGAMQVGPRIAAVRPV